jgi:conjugative transfer region protein TrbK
MQRQRDLLGQVLRIGALAALTGAISWAANSASKDPRPGAAVSPTIHPSNALDRELARCKFARPEQAAGDEACRRAWAEHRRRFITAGNCETEPSVGAVPASAAQPSSVPSKDQSRLGESRPSTSLGRRSE